MSPLSRPAVTAIVLAWNSADHIGRCIRSLIDSEYPVSIIVVDNASHDDTANVVQQFPQVAYRNTHANLGYAGGNNVGLRMAQEQGADYALILNPDAYVAPDCVGKLVAALEKHRAGAMASPKIYYAGSGKLWFAGASLDWKNGTSPHIGQGAEDAPAFSQSQIIPRANGCALLVRLSALEQVGLLDERYFLYFEEIDWSVRFTQQGHTIWFVADALCWHVASASTGGYFTPLYQYYNTRNSLLFMRTHHRTGWLLFLLRHTAGSARRLYHTLRNRPDNTFRVAKAIGKGYVDFTRGKFGRRPI